MATASVRRSARSRARSARRFRRSRSASSTGRRDGPAHPQVVERPLERLGDRRGRRAAARDRGPRPSARAAQHVARRIGQGAWTTGAAPFAYRSRMATLARRTSRRSASGGGRGRRCDDHHSAPQTPAPLWQVRHGGDGYDDGRVAAARDLDHPVTFHAGVSPRRPSRSPPDAAPPGPRRARPVAVARAHAAGRGDPRKIIADGCTIEQVAFPRRAGTRSPAASPTRRSGRLPAVLARTDTGRAASRSRSRTQKKAIASGAEQRSRAHALPLQRRHNAGADRRDHVRIGRGSLRRQHRIEHRARFTDAEAELGFQELLRLSMWNTVRAVDFLLAADMDPAHRHQQRQRQRHAKYCCPRSTIASPPPSRR